MKVIATFYVNENMLVNSEGGSFKSAFGRLEESGLFLDDYACCRDEVDLDGLGVEQIYFAEEEREAEHKFYYGLLDDYDVDEIFTNKADAENEMRKKKRDDLVGKIISYVEKGYSYRIFVEKAKGNRLEGILLSSPSEGNRISVDLDNGHIPPDSIKTCEVKESDIKLIVATRQNRTQEDGLER